MRKVDAFESSDENNTCNSLLGIKIKNIVTQKHPHKNTCWYICACVICIYTQIKNAYPLKKEMLFS